MNNGKNKGNLMDNGQRKTSLYKASDLEGLGKIFAKGAGTGRGGTVAPIRAGHDAPRRRSFADSSDRKRTIADVTDGV